MVPLVFGQPNKNAILVIDNLIFSCIAIYFRLLTVKSSGKSATRRQLELGSLLHVSQHNDDELLDLCSGKFSGGKAF